MLNQHQTTRDLIAKYNKPSKLVDFLEPFIRGKTKVTILDVGSGPFSIIGSYFDGVDLTIYHCDKQDFNEFWRKHKTTPIMQTEHQNMEGLTYPDNLFDVVCCINALDHTRDAQKAVEEMIRVCKPGGWIYIECNLDQLDTGHGHRWNADKYGEFTNNLGGKFHLLDINFHFVISFFDNGGESRYNKIIATVQK